MAFDMTTALTINAKVVGQSQISSLSTGLNKLGTSSNTATTAFGRLKTSAGGAIGALKGFLPVIGVAGIAAFAKSNLDAADAMSKLSQRTGVAAPELDKFRKVAELSDTSISSLERAFPALAGNMDTAAEKAKGPAFEAFQRLGISVEGADGNLRSVDSVMLDVADKFVNLEDGATKSALASDLFGTKLGSELIPLLNSGGDAVRDMGTAMTQEFADKAAEFNDKLENIQEKFGDLALKLTEALLPLLENLVDFIDDLTDGFLSLPEPVQTLILALGGLTAVATVFAPLITAVTSLGPLLTGIGTALAPIITALTGSGGLLTALAAVFTGPVGWAALLVGAGVALFAFRDEIGAFLNGLLEPFKVVFDSIGKAWNEAMDALSEPAEAAFNFLKENIFDPFVGFVVDLVAKIGEAWNVIIDVIKAPVEAVTSAVKALLNGIISAFENGVNNILGGINNLINGANKISRLVNGPQIPTIPQLNIPRFAKGGVVDGPTVALVGEAGSEYIVPEGKATGFAQNILAGKRGISAIPAFAKGGFISANGGDSADPNSVFDQLSLSITSSIQTAASQVVEVSRRILEAIVNLFDGLLSVKDDLGQLIFYTIDLINGVKLISQATKALTSAPRFAKGGMVNGPTFGMIGEAGPEYIVPENKAMNFAANIMSGLRGQNAIPAFANGGYVGSPNVQITTGPVMQQNGTNFVTLQEFEQGVRQVATAVARGGRSFGSRRFAGVS